MASASDSKQSANLFLTTKNSGNIIQQTGAGFQKRQVVPVCGWELVEKLRFAWIRCGWKKFQTLFDGDESHCIIRKKNKQKNPGKMRK